ncbi:MAG: CPBP family intramembrane glutamic endopeptidase [Phycisphaerales bacterium]
MSQTLETTHSLKRTTRTRALLALLLIAPAPSIGALMMFVTHKGEPIGQTAYALGKAWLYLFPVVWLLLVERGRLRLSRPARGGFAVAALLGILISAAIWAVWLLYARDHIDATAIREVSEKNGLNVAWKYIAACAWLAVVNAALEEYVFRWFIFRQCEKLLPGMVAVALSALLFTVHHVIVLKAYFDWPMTLLASFGVFMGGAIWSWCYLRYRSIWPGYLSHVIVDIAIFAIGWQLIYS